MKSIKTLVLVLCASLMFVACGEWNNKLKGGLLGGGGGAALGSLVGYLISKDGKGTAIGGAIGAAVGSGAGVYIGNRMDKAKAAAEAVENAKAELLEGPNGMKYVRVTFDSGILFTTGDAKLTNAAKASLNKFADEVLATNNDMDVAIMGYTDNAPWRGVSASESMAKNEKLSLERAQSVFNYLVQSGARTNQIKDVKGLGEQYPVADNSTVAGKAQNRRVEIYLVASPQMIKAAEGQVR